MRKLLLTILIQLFLITSLQALDDSKKVKSELLKAIHYSDTQEVTAITKREAKIVKADPVLQKMVDAYFEKERQALDELKAEIRAKKEAQRKAKENARIAVFLEEIAKKEALKEKNRTLRGNELQETTMVKMESKTKKTIPVPVSSTKVPRSVASTKTTDKVAVVTADVKKKSAKTYTSQTKPTNSKIVYREKTHRYLAKSSLSGEWKQDKKEKSIVFEMLADHSFILTERSSDGVLSLEGKYRQVDDNLLLDIMKITYNVKSRSAAVQRVYKFKTISKTKLLLLDEAGRIVYTLKR